MIVTRRRRKPFPYKRLVLPLIAIVLLVVALVWGPSRTAIVSGPLAPAFTTGGSAFGTIAKPFHFAAQNQVITQRNRTIAQLQSQLAAAQAQTQDKQRQIDQMQQQIGQLQSQAASARAVPAPRGAARPAVENAGAQGGLAATGEESNPNATPEMRRIAQYWASMDPENAAKIAQRLPPGYDAAVFALMQPDAVGAILDAVPPAFAAKLTRAYPEIRR